MGISKCYYNKIEQGNIEYSDNLFIQICKYYNIDPKEFLIEQLTDKIMKEEKKREDIFSDDYLRNIENNVTQFSKSLSELQKIIRDKKELQNKDPITIIINKLDEIKNLIINQNKLDIDNYFSDIQNRILVSNENIVKQLNKILEKLSVFTE